MQLFDLSDYLQNHKLFDPRNKKVPLTMKDELSREIILEATCLRSKIYSIKYESEIKQRAREVHKWGKNPSPRTSQ